MASYVHGLTRSFGEMTLQEMQRYYRPDEVARELGRAFGMRIPVSTVYEWIRRNRIAKVPVGRKVRVSRDELMRLIEKGIEVNRSNLTETDLLERN